MMLSARDIRFRYPLQASWALSAIDLQIRPGEITWLTGALGSGASTLLAVLGGLAPRLTGGELSGLMTADGIDLATTSPLMHGIACMGPSPTLQLSGIARTVRDEIAVTPMNLGHSRERITAVVDGAIAALHLESLATRDPTTLSGGETQRVILAALLAAEPSAWLLDEPFSALDGSAIVEVRQLLRTFADHGALVVIASDDADTMAGLADRIVVLQQGRIVINGDPAATLSTEAIIAAGAGSTNAATLARAAGWGAPWPLTTGDLIDRIDLTLPPSPMAMPELARADATDSIASPDAPPPKGHSPPLPILQLSAVQFGYDPARPVIRSLDLSVNPGESVGLLGHNGAGKSTVLRLAMALEHPTPGHGAVATLGLDTAGRDPEDYAPRVGFLFQHPERQLFGTTVGAECELVPRALGRDPAQTADATARVLDQLGLAETRETHPYDLPLPLRRLVALAAILVAQPTLLLLDEPTAGLDHASRDRVILAIRDARDAGVGVLASTHDGVFANETLDRAVVLGRGQIIERGPIQLAIDAGGLPRPAVLDAARALGLPREMSRRAPVTAALRSRDRGVTPPPE